MSVAARSLVSIREGRLPPGTDVEAISTARWARALERSACTGRRSRALAHRNTGSAGPRPRRPSAVEWFRSVDTPNRLAEPGRRSPCSRWRRSSSRDQPGSACSAGRRRRRRSRRPRSGWSLGSGQTFTLGLVRLPLRQARGTRPHATPVTSSARRVTTALSRTSSHRADRACTEGHIATADQLRCFRMNRGFRFSPLSTPAPNTQTAWRGS